MQMDTLEKAEIELLKKEITELSANILKAEKHRTRFLSNIRNILLDPLAVIQGFAELMAMGDPISASQAKSMGDSIYGQISKLNFELQNAISCAEAIEGKLYTDFNDLDLKDLLVQSTKAFRENLTYTLPEDEFILIHSDNDKLSLIVWNLLNYVSTHAEQVLRVDILTSIKDDEYEIEFHFQNFLNNAEEISNKLIDFSDKVDFENTSSKDLGLGLWLMHQYLRLLNGSISINLLEHDSLHVFLRFKPIDSTADLDNEYEQL